MFQLRADIVAKQGPRDLLDRTALNERSLAHSYLSLAGPRSKGRTKDKNWPWIIRAGHSNWNLGK